MSYREAVDLIASGYEWLCPECTEFQTEIEIPRNDLTCQKCGANFSVGEVYDARQ